MDGDAGNSRFHGDPLGSNLNNPHVDAEKDKELNSKDSSRTKSREGHRSRSISLSPHGRQRIFPWRRSPSPSRHPLSYDRQQRSSRCSISPRRFVSPWRHSPRSTPSVSRRRSPFSRRSPSIPRYRSPSPQQFLHLGGMWDEHHKKEYYSEQVEIVFSAIYTSVNQLGAKASAVQDRDVTKHLIEIWIDFLRSMMTKVEWRTSLYMPTAEEYMKNMVVTFALGPIVLPALYFVGPKIWESIVRDPEYNELFRLMSACGRLLNDVQSYEREGSQGKLNGQTEQCFTTCSSRCKELLWKMCKVCYFFYFGTDGFSSPKEKKKGRCSDP